MAIDWDDLTLAFLHDPPDKALDIKRHVSRACRYAATATGRHVESDALKHHSDAVASAIERLPMPKADVDKGLVVGPENGSLLVVHPLSGCQHPVRVGGVDEDLVVNRLRDLVQSCTTSKARFLTLWRLLPEVLSAEQSYFGLLPADTRTPDHTLWRHLDMTTAWMAASSESGEKALLSFSLGPVQSFIASARTVRDLWCGSMLLAWLTFKAMLPIIERFGPAAIIYPALRGIPLVDQWLIDRGGVSKDILNPDNALRKTPCIPNKFLALVPAGRGGAIASELAANCRTSTQKAWQEIANAVRSALDEQAAELCPDWAALWQEQIDNHFEVRAAWLPLSDSREEAERSLTELLSEESAFDDAFQEIAALRSLCKAIPEADRPGYDQGHIGLWQLHVELSSRLLQAQRSVRHFPVYRPQGEVPPKCSLMGSYEIMGPSQLKESTEFWSEFRPKIRGCRLREQERLCAPALVKRFAPGVFFPRELGISPEEIRYEDVATVAAARWYERQPQILREYANAQMNSAWLHWATPNDGQKDGEASVPDEVWMALADAKRSEPPDKPPSYYAVLMMDGDHMGEWLRGERSPMVRKVMHPKMVDYYESLGSLTKRGLDARRHVGPALHGAISEALANFALHFVPGIVDKHDGTLIYAGGDDVLALLPTETALDCALELRNTFSSNWKVDSNCHECLLMGETATLSAGLAVVHIKEDLRLALQAAREAEKTAKRAGRNLLTIATCRRSGEHSTCLCPWETTNEVMELVKAFKSGASDRWAYHLAQEVPTLTGLDEEAMGAEIRRQVDRSEKQTRELVNPAHADQAGRQLQARFAAYRRCASAEGRSRFQTAGDALKHFVTLCQTASFLARGRDQ